MARTISVIIPHFRNVPAVKRALASIAKQTYPPAEVIIVDDNSGPAYLNQLHQLQIAHGFKLFSLGLNLGQSNARNHGASLAKGQILAFLDQDDEWLPSHLADARKTFGKFPECDFTFSAAQIVTESGRRSELFQPRVSRSITLAFSRNLNVLPSTLSVNRTAFIKTNGFDSSLRGYEDDDLILRFLLEGLSFCQIRKTSVLWHRSSGSSSTQPSMLESKFVFMEKWAFLRPQIKAILVIRFIGSIWLDALKVCGDKETLARLKTRVQRVDEAFGSKLLSRFLNASPVQLKRLRGLVLQLFPRRLG